MQTFLPYADFEASARALDDRRLGKQRVEAYQIVRAAKGITRGWRNHPATLMWRGHEGALQLYMNACIREWRRRGFTNTMSLARPRRADLPAWLGDERLHASHRANLLRKDPAHYGAHGWTDDPSLPYWWPVARPEPVRAPARRRVAASA